MKTKYTKKQITEAISYWKGVLKKMNESVNADERFIIKYIPAGDEDDCGKPDEKGFKSKPEALKYAKDMYFTVGKGYSKDWYEEPNVFPEDSDVSTYEEVADLDYHDFAKHKKFDFNDGMYTYGTLKLIIN